MEPKYTSFEQLPIFLDAPTLANTLGISKSKSYELMNSKNFPAIRVGKRIVVEKQQLITWLNRKR